MSKKQEKVVDWLFDEYGNMLKRPIEKEPKKKSKPFEYHVIEADSEEDKIKENGN